MRISHEAIYQAASSSPACTPAGRFDIRSGLEDRLQLPVIYNNDGQRGCAFMPTRCILGLRAASTHRSQQ
jgi:hypothetical protein